MVMVLTLGLGVLGSNPSAMHFFTFLIVTDFVRKMGVGPGLAI